MGYIKPRVWEFDARPIASIVGCTPPQPVFLALSNAYAPPSGAAFAFPTPVEALWKQEGAKSLETQ